MNIGGFPKIIKIILWPFRFIGLNLYMWLRFPLALFPHPEVKKGDRFLVLEDIEAEGLTHYNAPFTDGFRCIIPENTIVVASRDSHRISLGFVCVPENKEQFEKIYVPEEQRRDAKYAGYSLVVRYKEIGRKLKKV